MSTCMREGSFPHFSNSREKENSCERHLKVIFCWVQPPTWKNDMLWHKARMMNDGSSFVMLWLNRISHIVCEKTRRMKPSSGVKGSHFPCMNNRWDIRSRGVMRGLKCPFSGFRKQIEWSPVPTTPILDSVSNGVYMIVRPSWLYGSRFMTFHQWANASFHGGASLRKKFCITFFCLQRRSWWTFPKGWETASFRF
jgi:hypothetical protein